MTNDVFISYSKNDKTVADAVCAKLESHKIRCWIAPRDVPPGKSWAGSIIHAIKTSQIMVLVFSDGSNNSVQVLREVDSAVEHGIPIIPFRIEDVEPSEEMRYYIKSIHWLDAMSPPLEKHLDTLTRSVRALLSVGEDQPSIPVASGLDAPAPKRNAFQVWAIRLILLAFIFVFIGIGGWMLSRWLSGANLEPIAMATPLSLAVTPMSTPPPTGTPTSTPIPTGTPTPTPTPTITPIPTWVNEFAQPILESIAGQTPNFEEDFSGPNSNLRLHRVTHEESREEPLQISDYISDGMLKLDMQMPGNYHISGDMISSSNFALQFDTLPKSGINSLEVDFRASSDIYQQYALILEPCCENWELAKISESGTESFTRGKSEAIAHQKPVQVLMVAQDDQFAVYLNGQPLAYFQDDELRYGLNWIRISTDDMGGQAEFDNLKFWRLNGP
ncbi:MAG: toll/interleukin-1 receptor domain-containing protein [Chloroflexi bacterium]|nr:toll/interleukin-1 receptor domain-containing protein [Chloroflexota bacterium]